MHTITVNHKCSCLEDLQLQYASLHDVIKFTSLLGKMSRVVT